MAYESGHTFQNKNLRKMGYMFFRNTKHNEEFCDLIFHIGGKTVKAHRIVVAATIPYYRKFLANKNEEENDSEKEFIMPDGIDPEAFENLIEYAYTGEVIISDENVKFLLRVASHLDVKEVIGACCDFLVNTLNPQNVFQIRDFACGFEYGELLKEVDEYICENFSKLSQMEEFSSLPLQCVEELLSRDDLRVSSEEKVFASVMKWVNKCPEQRKSNLPELLKKVRMTLLDPRYLKDYVSSERLIQESIQCRDLLDEARNYHFFPDDRITLNSFSVERRCKALNRSSAENEESIYAFTVSTNFTLQHFNQQQKTWKRKGSKHFNHVIAGSAAVGSKIYYLFWQGITEYDPLENQYKICKYLHTSKCWYGVASVSGKIYACGGRDSRSSLKTVDCYDPEMNSWENVRDMLECRCAPGTTALAECIYVLGGHDGRSINKSVEKYDVQSGKWRAVASMLTERYEFGCTTLNGRIYACGGVTTDIVYTPTAEVYDPIENEWMFVSSMNTVRHGFKLLPYSGNLYAVGGNDDNTSSIYSVEIYNPESSKWQFGNEVNPGYISAAEVIATQN